MATALRFRGIAALAIGCAPACMLVAGLEDRALLPFDGSLDGASTDGSPPDGAVDDAKAGRIEPVLVRAGQSTTCAVMSDGEVWCWGNNANGKAGVAGNTPKVPTAARVAIAGATDVGVGFDFTCALVTGGKVKCWGANDQNQLGTPVGPATSTPVDVSGLPNDDPVAKLVVGGVACALTTTGRLFCWGSNTTGLLGIPPSGVDGGLASSPPVELGGRAVWHAVAVGITSACGLRGQDRLWCWGDSAFGVLGRSGSTGYAPEETSPPVTPTAIAMGNGFQCLRAQTGDGVLCCGTNFAGERGRSINVGTFGPTFLNIESMRGSPILGDRNTCVLSEGRVYCVGDSQIAGSQDGGPAVVKAEIPDIFDAIQLSVGYRHACALLNGPVGGSKSIECWGLGTDGQLGDGLTFPSPTPVAVAGLPKGLP